MKYVNTLSCIIHLYGMRTVLAKAEFELSLIEERYPMVRALLEKGHIRPVVGESSNNVVLTPNGTRVILPPEPVKVVEEPKALLRDIERVVESAVVTTIENQISSDVPGPIGEGIDAEINALADSFESRIHIDEVTPQVEDTVTPTVEKITTGTEVDVTQKPGPKTYKKKSSK